ncbi:MAG: ABC transporter ATP-binding protein [Gammaproteobacteria bacterium]
MAIELRQVTKRVGAETHIYPVDLKLTKGAFNVLLGTTLSGKTTLMRLMAGLEKPTQGEIWFNGENVTGVPVQKRSVAMVYQAFINYPSYTVYENIASPLRVARLPRERIDRRVRQIAELLKLTPLLDRVPAELSGGQQQRTALARALVKQAELVLLDEPLANLDYKLREELRDELPRLFEHTGATVVYATSEPLEALLLGGYTATLEKGRVIQYGPTSNVYRHPSNLTSAQVFSDPPINTAEITKRENRFHLTDSIHWPVPDRFRHLADGGYFLGIRPYHLSLNRVSGTSITVKGRVLVAEISGSESVVHISFEHYNWISESHGIHPYKVGDTAELYINVERCLLFSKEGDLIATETEQAA